MERLRDVRASGGGIEREPIRVDSVLLVDVVRAILHRCGGPEWLVQRTDAWHSVRLPTTPIRQHGWKIHVSATPLSAPLVLARVADVLVRHGCSFKFALDIARVAELVSVWFPRGSAGKFITAYPHDDEQFRTLVRDLHQATAGLAGPRNLSDKQFDEDSLVHYRYGVFADELVFTDDGTFESRLVGPDGRVVRDERKAWFSPPAWAPAPFPGEPVTPATLPTSPTLGGRFLVRGVIRHANRGGIYRAMDEHGGAEVLIKQARPHVGAMLDGTDVRDRLREEAAVLGTLEPLALFPAVVALFEEQGHLFLAEELIPGSTLDRWVSAGGVPSTELVRRLVEAVRQVHDAGFAIRDLKPSNVMVTPDGAVRMVDAEHVAALGRRRYPAFTRAFAAPEVPQTGLPTVVTASAQSADRFSLGVTLFSAFTGLTDVEWVFGSGQVPRSEQDRATLLPRILADHRVPPAIGELIAGLTRTDPDARWTLDQAEKYLCGEDLVSPVSLAASSREPDRLLTDGIVHLRQTMHPDQDELWPDQRVLKTDPANAWLGAAGGLSALTRAATVFGDESLAAALGTAAGWVDKRLFAAPRLLPGLSFGRAGTAWALYDAAVVLGQDGLARRALDLAGRLPSHGSVVDVTHGLSGAGLTHLHLWLNTGESSTLRSAMACADAVVAAAHRTGLDWTWPTPTDADSAVAGTNSYGFAHGIAGVGAFLLATAEAVDTQTQFDASSYWEAAIGAGDTLVWAARIQDGLAVWPAEVGGQEPVIPSGHWCNGAAGIGTFLIRLWSATGEQRFAELAQRCVPSRRTLWHSVVGACCGLAGVGHSLLDLADYTGDHQFRAEAEHVADLIHLRRRLTGDLEVLAERSAYKDGTAGVLMFLLRLRHGGPTPWLPHRHAVAIGTPGSRNQE